MRLLSSPGSIAVFRFIALGAGLPGIDCGREQEMSTEAAKRAGRTFQGVAVPWQIFDRPVIHRGEKRVDPMTSLLPLAGPGGSWIPTEHLGQEFISALYARLVLQRLGARVIDGLTANIDIPKLVASAEASWFAENVAIPLSSATAGKLEGVPKFVGSLGEFSRPMILQSSPEIERITSDDYLNLHRRAIDRAAIAASMANGPTGILGSGLDVTVTMAAPTWAGVLSLIQKVEDQDSEGNAFLTSPSVVQLLRSTAKVSGTDSAMIQESPNELAGYPLGSTTLCPVETLIFGNFRDVLILGWEAFDLLVNPFETTAYSKGNIQVRMISAVDVAVRHSKSFAASTDVGAVS
jgi:HK97 family phage major capsid protein